MSGHPGCHLAFPPRESILDVRGGKLLCPKCNDIIIYKNLYSPRRVKYMCKNCKYTLNDTAFILNIIREANSSRKCPTCNASLKWRFNKSFLGCMNYDWRTNTGCCTKIV
jgi:ssDNA-binding Zn-finger/Zn-ribbon topoisomerase 1